MQSTYPPAPSSSFAALPSSQPYVSSPPPVNPAQSFDANLIPPFTAASPPSSTYADAFAPAMHGADDPFAPKPPTHNDIASEILKVYSQTPTSTAGSANFNFNTPNGPSASPAQGANGVSTPQQPLSMNGLITSGEEEENLSELEKAMRKLVNIDHIDEPAEEKIKLTMKVKEDEEAKKARGKSKPLPPAAQRLVGSHATLQQIGTVKPKKEPKEGIMRALPQPWDPNAAAAGMLVVHGQGNMGPPPLQPRGFGIVHGQQLKQGQKTLVKVQAHMQLLWHSRA